MGSASITAASSLKKTIDSRTAKIEHMKEMHPEPNLSENIYVWTLTCVLLCKVFIKQQNSKSVIMEERRLTISSDLSIKKFSLYGALSTIIAC